MDMLTILGLFAVTAMLVFLWLDQHSVFRRHLAATPLLID
jgi:hypothetical protein